MKVRTGFYKFIPIWYDPSDSSVVPRQLWLFGVFDFLMWFDLVIRKKDKLDLFLNRKK